MYQNNFFTIERPDLLIYLSFFFFFLDNLINFFYEIPVFVACTPLLILITIFTLKGKNNIRNTFSIFFLVTLSFFVNIFRYGFEKDSITDYLFLSLAILSIGCAFQNTPKYETIRNISIICILMFIPAFLGINGSGFGNKDVFNSGSNDLEYFRVYNQGLYRLPHTASYLLALSCIWWLYIWSKNKKIRYLSLFFLSFVCCLYTGSRTPIFAIGLAIFLIYFSLKPLKLFIFFLFALSSFFIFLNIDGVLDFFNGTFIYQYISIIKTFQSDYERLSRYIIWSNWLEAIKDFSIIDWFFGKGFNSSLMYNEKTLGNRIWFHNDFLSILYSYGVLGFIGYFLLLASFVRKGIKFGGFLVAICAYFIILSGLFNGFYKYMPIAFLYFISYSLYGNKFLVRGNR